jgi:predicted metal-binding protein
MIKIEELIQFAHESGANEAVVIPTADIKVDSKLAEKCFEPRCENYGLSKSCPPNVAGPVKFKEKLENYSKAILFKIDVPSEILYSSQGIELFKLLHQIAASIETSAVKKGFENASGYAGGSCKKLFCQEHFECTALSEKQECRNPRFARPSMSGFGINVAELFKTAGWKMSWATQDADSTEIKMANICGLVLIY